MLCTEELHVMYSPASFQSRMKSGPTPTTGLGRPIVEVGMAKVKWRGFQTVFIWKAEVIHAHRSLRMKAFGFCHHWFRKQFHFLMFTLLWYHCGVRWTFVMPLWFFPFPYRLCVFEYSKRWGLAVVIGLVHCGLGSWVWCLYAAKVKWLYSAFEFDLLVSPTVLLPGFDFLYGELGGETIFPRNSSADFRAQKRWTIFPKVVSTPRSDQTSKVCEKPPKSLSFAGKDWIEWSKRWPKNVIWHDDRVNWWYDMMVFKDIHQSNKVTSPKKTTQEHQGPSKMDSKLRRFHCINLGDQPSDFCSGPENHWEAFGFSAVLGTIWCSGNSFLLLMTRNCLKFHSLGRLSGTPGAQPMARPGAGILGILGSQWKVRQVGSTHFFCHCLASCALSRRAFWFVSDGHLLLAGTGHLDVRVSLRDGGTCQASEYQTGKMKRRKDENDKRRQTFLEKSKTSREDLVTSKLLFQRSWEVQEMYGAQWGGLADGVSLH